jgi:hypothetical protein
MCGIVKYNFITETRIKSVVTKRVTIFTQLALIRSEKPTQPDSYCGQ